MDINKLHNFLTSYKFTTVSFLSNECSEHPLKIIRNLSGSQQKTRKACSELCQCNRKATPLSLEFQKPKESD